MGANDLLHILVALTAGAGKAQPLWLVTAWSWLIRLAFLAVFYCLNAGFIDDLVATFWARFMLCHAASVGASVYSETGGQLHTRLRSPYTLSIRPTGGQYRSFFSESVGKAAC